MKENMRNYDGKDRTAVLPKHVTKYRQDDLPEGFLLDMMKNKITK